MYTIFFSLTDRNPCKIQKISKFASKFQGQEIFIPDALTTVRLRKFRLFFSRRAKTISRITTTVLSYRTISVSLFISSTITFFPNSGWKITIYGEKFKEHSHETWPIISFFQFVHPTPQKFVIARGENKIWKITAATIKPGANSKLVWSVNGI